MFSIERPWFCFQYIVRRGALRCNKVIPSKNPKIAYVLSCGNACKQHADAEMYFFVWCLIFGSKNVSAYLESNPGSLDQSPRLYQLGHTGAGETSQTADIECGIFSTSRTTKQSARKKASDLLRYLHSTYGIKLPAISRYHIINESNRNISSYCFALAAYLASFNGYLCPGFLSLVSIFGANNYW